MSEEPNSEEPNSEERPKRTGPRRLLPTWRTVLGATVLTALAGCGAFIAGYLLVDIPAPNSAAAAQNNVYLYSDGTQLARDGEINRQKVELKDIPETTRQAVLAAEDRDFYHQSAVDITAMARAGWNMLQGKGKQSGSTITQQYVKNYYLGQEQTLTRKAREFFIAIKLDRETSKDDILAGYLNTSYFGRNSYGVQAAAQAYYSKDAADLTTAEGAYLAALLNSPNLYDVAAHPENKERALARWNYVLDGMVAEGWLKPSERADLTFPTPDPAKPPTGLSGQRGYIVEAVNRHLVDNDIIDERRLAQGGFRITTTIDRRKQQAMVEAVEKELLSHLSDDRQVDRYVRAGSTSIDPETGEVVAMYGGIDYTRQFVNNATRRDYQAGSTFKPFVYAAALEHDAKTRDGKRIGPNTVYDGTSGRTVIGPQGPTTWKPQNEDETDYGDIPVSTAMNKSVNAVFAQMGVDIGPEKVRKTALALGLPEKTPGAVEAHASLSLGTASPSTLDMAQAYATLANHGKRVDHTLVKEIVQDGEPVRLPKPRPEQAVSRATADATTAVLRGVVEEGTGATVKAAGRPAAGKTGTAEEDRAAWFAGYTPDLVTVVAVMGQDPDTGVHKPLYGAGGLARVNGSDFPSRIWAAYTARALQGSPAKKFDLKPGGKHRMPKASPDPSEKATPDTDPTRVADEPDDSPAPEPDDDGKAAADDEAADQREQDTDDRNGDGDGKNRDRPDHDDARNDEHRTGGNDKDAKGGDRNGGQNDKENPGTRDNPKNGDGKDDHTAPARSATPEPTPANTTGTPR
ncbi:transglycosylase domain-containing protein [Streptomyces megasporus]|uniref:transglycosylase domain-containing protein n=1 Tax=Streptomyces megasporus TaxID=44060 RepID=UPI00068F12F3|nr:transglycosylase domain-containing protein [Streptomyces megasporus]